MKKFCNVNNYEFIIFSPKEKKFYIEEDDNLKNIEFNRFLNLKYINNVSNFIFSNENTLNMKKHGLLRLLMKVKLMNNIIPYVKLILNYLKGF